MSLVLRSRTKKIEDLEPEEDFEEIPEDELEKQLASDTRMLKPLTDELAERLSTIQQPDSTQEVRSYYKSHCENMDKMGDLYIPTIIRDQFYYMRRMRKWRFMILTFNKTDSKFIEIYVCGKRDETFE